MRTPSWMTLIACGAVTACAASPDDTLTTRELLSEGQVFEVDPETSSAFFHATVRVGEARLDMTVEAPVRGGVFVASLDEKGALTIDDLTVGHESFPLLLEVGVRGFQPWIGALEVRAETLQLPGTVWDDDGELAMTATGRVLVTTRWGIRAPHLPTGSFERVTVLDAAAMVLSDDDSVEVFVGGETGKVAWSWAGMTFSSTLELSIDASIARP